MIKRPLFGLLLFVPLLLGPLLIVPFLGGCVLDKAPSADAPSGGKAARASDDDDDKPKREQCEHTMEGTEAKTFCY